MSRLIVNVSPDTADVVPVPPDIFNVSVASEIVALDEASVSYTHLTLPTSDLV